MMRVLWCADAVAAAQTAAEIVARQVRGRPASVLGLPTGESALAIYDRLAALAEAGLVSFRAVTSFNLDEYVGLAGDHPASYRAYMDRHFARRLDVAPGRVHVPAGDAADLDGACRAYEAAIVEAGGWDLAVLGLGRNGHIAFNEPGSAPDSRTRVVELAGETRAANAARFPSPEPVPTRAVTVGVGTILEARSILLVAAGAGKQAALSALLKGGVDSAWPATQLWRHDDVTVIADAALRPPA